MSEPDPGVGNERTALAWQRTALSVVAGAAILSRLTYDRVGVAALLSVLVAAPLGLWVFFESHRRYAHGGTDRRRYVRGGRAPMALTVATMVVGMSELVALLVVG
jgi:uncharacterized membrane protein YidH (DUF202 family)